MASYINGVKYNGNNISVVNGVVTIDGKRVDNLPDQPVINIIIEGDVSGSVSNDSGDIKVTGSAGSVKSSNGNITIGGSADSSVQTTNGNIKVRGNVKGNATTVNGDIKHSKF